LTVDDATHNCCYSITSIPTDERYIEIAVKLAPDFPITQHLHQHSKAGDQLFISKAQGNVYLDNNFAGPYVFIAGGIGVTPLYSMVRYLLASGAKEPVVLLYSIATMGEFLFQDELRELQRQYDNFRLITTMTRGNNVNGNDHYQGRITKAMVASLQLPIQANYYLCGPPPMVDSVADLLTTMQKDLQISTDNIHYDKWWT
jgi:ferredoxin-NADP reductase